MVVHFGLDPTTICRARGRVFAPYACPRIFMRRRSEEGLLGGLEAGLRPAERERLGRAAGAVAARGAAPAEGGVAGPGLAVVALHGAGESDGEALEFGEVALGGDPD